VLAYPDCTGILAVSRVLCVRSSIVTFRKLDMNGSMKEPNISNLDIFLFFPPTTRWYSVSDVLFTGGRGVSDFSVLKYY